MSEQHHAAPPDSDELMAAALNVQTEQVTSEPESNDKIAKVSRAISLALMMALAACLGFALMQVDFKELTGNTGRPGDRNIVWRKVLNGFGVEVKQYRSDRQQKYGKNGEFANDGWVNDIQMFITDSLGPGDD